jgi:hypothetical protein
MAEANGDVLYASGTEYVSHHLGFLTYGKLDGHWGFAHTPEEAAQMGFWAINVDTMLISMILGVLFMGFYYFVSRKVTSGVPGGVQNFVEMIIEFVIESVEGAFHAKNKFVAPLALTTFSWIFLMNAMDLVPVDWIPLFAQTVAGDSHLYFKAVPTTDINITLGFATAVFIMVISPPWLSYLWQIRWPLGLRAHTRRSGTDGILGDKRRHHADLHDSWRAVYGFLLFRLSQGYFRRPWRRAKFRRDDYRIRYRKR